MMTSVHPLHNKRFPYIVFFDCGSSEIYKPINLSSPIRIFAIIPSTPKPVYKTNVASSQISNSDTVDVIINDVPVLESTSNFSPYQI